LGQAKRVVVGELAQWIAQLSAPHAGGAP
jgi:hypothetical protein